MQNFPLVPKTLFWYNIGGLFPWERIIGKRGHWPRVGGRKEFPPPSFSEKENGKARKDIECIR